MKKPLHPLILEQLELITGEDFLLQENTQLFISQLNTSLEKHLPSHSFNNPRQNGADTKRLALVASLNRNGVVFTDAAGIITWHNEGFQDLTGFSSSEILGKTPVQLLAGPGTDPKTLKEMLDLFYAGKPFAPELLCYRKDGSSFWGRCSGQAIVPENNEPIEFFAIVEDITTQKLAQQKLERQEAKYRNIIANMHLGLLEVDLEQKVIYVNNSFCEMSGYTREELMGVNPWSLFANEKDQGLMDTKSKMREKGISDAYEISVKDKKGTIKWWLVSAAPSYNDAGELVGSTGIHLDITDQKYMEDALIKSWEHAEESSRAKENFLANMSHEMRTPMNAIMGMTRQLAKSGLRADQKFYVENISGAADNLLVIMNDILDISKIEAGQLVIEHLPFRLDDVINQVIRMHELKAEEKGLSLQWSIASTIHPEFKGDPFRLQQILLNLTGNAIKFTSQGSVRISGEMVSETPDEQMVRISVSDTGVGMDEEFLKRIFEKFSQEDRSIARKFGGTGLGMSIVKNLAELLGGSVQIKSEKDKGTTVDVLIPLEKSVSTASISDTVESSGEELRGKKILLVEDNEMNIVVARMLLEQYDMVITQAGNGEAALHILEKENFDLILMDIQMPVMDGLTATRKLREEMSIHTPVIALTAHALQGEAEKCLDAGMNDFLSKPYKEKSLVDMLTKWVSSESSPTSIAVAPPVSMETLEAYSGGDPEFLQSLIAVFCRQTPIAVVEMQRGFEERNFEAMSAAAHRIKPSLEMVGAADVAEMLVSIEHWDKNKDNRQLKEMLDQVSGRVEAIVQQLQAQSDQ